MVEKSKPNATQQIFQENFFAEAEKRLEMSRHTRGFMTEVAKKLKLKQISVVQRWFEGGMPDIPHLVQIYDAWGVTPNELLGIKDGIEDADASNENLAIQTIPEYSIEDCAKIIGFPTDKVASWISAIERKKQAIFYGPPGTGKTFISSHLARHIVGGTDGIMDCIQFHPAYTYEEFIQGICPNADEKGNLQFDLKSGRFLEFCAKARHRTGPCVLIIHEINRANIARVFGELMYLLEYREKDMPLAGGIRFSIPNNVLIIGTMNTADRSIALVDLALRRRFAFLDLSPEYDILKAFQQMRGFDAGGLVRALLEVNTKINDKNYYLGISFFMVDDLAKKLEEIWKMEIETYLEEYFFSQPEVMNNFRWDRMRGKMLP